MVMLRRPYVVVVRRPKLQRSSLTETAWPIKAKTSCGTSLGRGTKFYINGPGHMAKMVAMVMIEKPVKIFFFQNQNAYEFEAGHEALRSLKQFLLV